jgi:hypothetical protein
VCAPLELRIRRMMQRLDTDDRAFVENEIRLSEEAHAAITRRHFQLDWHQPEHYDLVLNTGRVSIEQCVNQIAALLHERVFQETPESMRVLGDLALETHVRAALRADPRTAKLNILIEAAGGQVTLAGMLDMGLEERDAIEIASAVKGVTDVSSRLRSQAQSRYKIDA